MEPKARFPEEFSIAEPVFRHRHPERGHMDEKKPVGM